MIEIPIDLMKHLQKLIWWIPTPHKGYHLHILVPWLILNLDSPVRCLMYAPYTWYVKWSYYSELYCVLGWGSACSGNQLKSFLQSSLCGKILRWIQRYRVLFIKAFTYLELNKIWMPSCRWHLRYIFMKKNCLYLPLHEPILTSHQWSPVTITWRQLRKRYPSHHLLELA